MTYLFLDTNIYLHYNDYEQIKWKDHITDIGDFSIVVPEIVRQEINKQKDKAKSKIKKRATRLISRLKDIHLYGTTSVIPLLTSGLPPDNDYNGIKFHKECQDDTVILSILDFKKDHPEDRIILIAADFDVLLKAKENGIEFLELPETDKLKEELSDEEKKIKELEKQLAIHIDRLPGMEIYFSNAEKLLKYKRPDIADIDKLVEAKVNEEKARHPNLRVPQEDYVDYLPQQLLNSVAKSNIQLYNGELHDYFKEYENYIRKKTTWDIENDCMSTIVIYVENNGTLDATNIRCIFSFPDDISLYSENNIKAEDVIKPILPQQPGIGRTNRVALVQLADIGRTRCEFIKYYDLSVTNKNKSYTKSIPNLLHHSQMKIDFKNDFFINTRSCKNFKIHYEIVVSELPEPVTGDLNVVFE